MSKKVLGYRIAQGFIPYVTGYAVPNFSGITSNLLQKHGNIVMFKFDAINLATSTQTPTLTIPKGFRPKVDTFVSCAVNIYQNVQGSINYVSTKSVATIKPDGTVVLDGLAGVHFYHDIRLLNVYWETE